MVWPLDESQGSSPLQGQGSWLVCEVALILPSHPGWNPQPQPYIAFESFTKRKEKNFQSAPTNIHGLNQSPHLILISPLQI